MSETIILDWSEGFLFTDLLGEKRTELKKRFNTPGIYIHLDHRKKDVAYVGKACGSPNLWKRQYEHYLNYVGGRYKIPTLHGSGYSWEPGLNESGYLEKISKKEEFKRIVDLAFDYIPKITIHLCKINKEICKIAEDELIYILQPLDNTKGKENLPQERKIFNHNCNNFTKLEKLLSSYNNHIIKNA